MQSINIIKTIVGPLAIFVVLFIGWRTREIWKVWLIPDKQAKTDDEKRAGADSRQRGKISEKERRNPRLVVREATLTAYRRKIYLRAQSLTAPGIPIVAPARAGVVTQVNLPGKTMPATNYSACGASGDSFQSSQMELFKRA